MTKSTERARHASKPKSAVRHQKNKKRTGEAPKPAEGHVGKTDITPEAFFLAWGRRRKEALIEVLIDSLDAADGDPDLEDGGDRELDAGEEPEIEDEHGDGNPDYEPSLGWTAREAAFGRYAEFNGCVDLEEQCEDEGDQSDSGIGDQDGLMEQCAGHRAVNGSWAGRTRYEPYVS